MANSSLNTVLSIANCHWYIPQIYRIRRHTPHYIWNGPQV